MNRCMTFQGGLSDSEGQSLLWGLEELLLVVLWQ